MNNSKNEKLSECESLQISVLSDEELTDELKRHLESCGKCRAFFQQNSQIKDELSGLSIPGLKDGEIADRVMKEIRTSKSISFPRVRLTHHIGTAAALVIVIALFAANKGYDLTSMISSKNGADNFQNEKISDTADTADAGSGFTPINGVFTSSDGQNEKSGDNNASSERSLQDTSEQKNEIALQNDENPTVTFRTSVNTGSTDVNSDDESKTVQKRTVTHTDLPGSSDSEQTKSASDNTAAGYGSDTAQSDGYTGGIMFSLSPSASYVGPETDTGKSAETAESEKSAAESSVDSEPICGLPKYDGNNESSSNGGGSSPAKAPAANSNAIDFEDDRAGFYDGFSETYNSIFENIEFNQSDDALDENVTTANKYVKSIFDEASQLRTEALTNIGITNSMFIEWAETVENAEQYSFESIYEYFNR